MAGISDSDVSTVNDSYVSLAPDVPGVTRDSDVSAVRDEDVSTKPDDIHKVEPKTYGPWSKRVTTIKMPDNKHLLVPSSDDQGNKLSDEEIVNRAQNGGMHYGTYDSDGEAAAAW